MLEKKLLCSGSKKKKKSVHKLSSTLCHCTAAVLEVQVLGCIELGPYARTSRSSAQWDVVWDKMLLLRILEIEALRQGIILKMHT